MRLRLLVSGLGLVPCLLAAPALGQKDELAEAIAEADRLDPGWRYDDLLAKRRATRPPDGWNSVLQAKRVLELLPKGWLAPKPGDADRPPAHGEPIRGFRIYDALLKVAADQPLPEPLAAGLRIELDELAPAVTEARKLVDFPEGQTEFLPAHNPIETLLPYTQDSRQLARLLQLDAYRRAHDGDLAGALESVRAILNDARSIGDEPTLISQLVRMAIDSVAVHSLQRVLAQGAPPDAALAETQADLLREATQPRFLHGLRGERAMSFDVIDKLASGALRMSDLAGAAGGAEQARGLIPPNIVGRVIYRHNQALALRKMNEAVEIAKLPLPDQAERWERWEDGLKELQNQGQIQRMANTLVLLLLPAMSAGYRADQRTGCMLNAAATAVACERFRQAEGRWPDSLRELVPRYLRRLPADPYDGQPLKLAKHEAGLVIYGVGQDRTDDGGKLHPQGRSEQPGFDVGVRLFDPDRRAAAE
jgi:hypothetical protein